MFSYWNIYLTQNGAGYYFSMIDFKICVWFLNRKFNKPLNIKVVPNWWVEMFHFKNIRCFHFIFRMFHFHRALERIIWGFQRGFKYLTRVLISCIQLMALFSTFSILIKFQNWEAESWKSMKKIPLVLSLPLVCYPCCWEPRECCRLRSPPISVLISMDA